MNAFDLAYSVGAVLLLPVWARKSRQDWRERLGHTSPLPPTSVSSAASSGSARNADGVSTNARPRILLHAVSVGEVNTLRGLVPLLARNAEVVISVGTDTGIARARAIFASEAPSIGVASAPRADAASGSVSQTSSQAIRIVRYPLDFSRCVNRFLDAVRPDVVGLVELEVWPNFVASCARRGIPIGVINGRLSSRSFKGYRCIRPIIGPTFSRLAFAAVQDEHYAQRFMHMGVPKDRVSVTGSMKWDSALDAMRLLGSSEGTGGQAITTSAAVSGATPVEFPGASELAAQMGIDRTRPLIVAGSTAEGEEALLHESCPTGVQLLCAPRKPERFDEAAAAMPGCARRSQTRTVAPKRTAVGTGLTPTGLGSNRVRDRFLLDTIGELRTAYALADVVVMGRSFGNLHGSDPLEPIGLGKATIIGPRFGDFATIVDALVEAGAIQIVNGGELRNVLSRLLNDPARRAEMARRGRACITQHAGATAKHAAILTRLTDPASTQ